MPPNLTLLSLPLRSEYSESKMPNWKGVLPSPVMLQGRKSLKDILLCLDFVSKFNFLIGVALQCSVSACCESAIRIQLSLLFQIFSPFRSPQSIKQSSLCYTVGPHLLICFMHSSVHMPTPICQFAPTPLLPFDKLTELIHKAEMQCLD